MAPTPVDQLDVSPLAAEPPIRMRSSPTTSILYTNMDDLPCFAPTYEDRMKTVNRSPKKMPMFENKKRPRDENEEPTGPIRHRIPIFLVEKPVRKFRDPWLPDLVTRAKDKSEDLPKASARDFDWTMFEAPEIKEQPRVKSLAELLQKYGEVVDEYPAESSSELIIIESDDEEEAPGSVESEDSEYSEVENDEEEAPGSVESEDSEYSEVENDEEEVPGSVDSEDSEYSEVENDEEEMPAEPEQQQVDEEPAEVASTEDTDQKSPTYISNLHQEEEKKYQFYQGYRVSNRSLETARDMKRQRLDQLSAALARKAAELEQTELTAEDQSEIVQQLKKMKRSSDEASSVDIKEDSLTNTLHRFHLKMMIRAAIKDGLAACQEKTEESDEKDESPSADEEGEDV